jgi:vacuolar iron transporter family protein
MPRAEKHYVTRTGWLRAAVLGANDGIISTASLIMGVASAAAPRTEILTAALAGLAAGAMAMAAGEYVSVSSQADSEAADLERERRELAISPQSETNELATIYEGRGLEPTLARTVAEALMARDALNAHARDELGISKATTAQPIVAAFASAITFSTGAAMPTLAALFAPESKILIAVPAASLVFLAALGALGAFAGGAKILRPTLRVAFWGATAMAVTAGIGALIGKAV